jgi:hypothetical protein
MTIRGAAHQAATEVARASSARQPQSDDDADGQEPVIADDEVIDLECGLADPPGHD